MSILLSITTQRQSLFNFDLTEILIRTQKLVIYQEDYSYQTLP